MPTTARTSPPSGPRSTPTHRSSATIRSRLEAILARLAQALGHNAAARAAVDMALHDLAGQCIGLPLWRWWGLERNTGPLTSFTIGLAAPAVVAQRAKAAAAAGFPLLKIKLGSGDLAQDRAILAAVREATNARLMVDANAAWLPQEAVQLGPDLVAGPASSYWSSQWRRANLAGMAPRSYPRGPCR